VKWNIYSPLSHVGPEHVISELISARESLIVKLSKGQQGETVDALVVTVCARTTYYGQVYFPGCGWTYLYSRFDGLLTIAVAQLIYDWYIDSLLIDSYYL